MQPSLQPITTEAPRKTRVRVVKASCFDRAEIMRNAHRIFRFQTAKHDRIAADLVRLGRPVTRKAPTFGECMAMAWAKARRAIAMAAAEIAAAKFYASMPAAERAASDARIIAGVASFGNN